MHKYPFNFADTVEIIPISFNLTMTGVNKTSFTELKSYVENAVAEITNSSPSSVTSTFIETVTILSTKKVHRYFNEEHSNDISKRSSPNGALINVAISPMDSANEKEVLGIINSTSSFTFELNSRLENHSNIDASVTSISQIQRIPGKLFLIR